MIERSIGVDARADMPGPVVTAAVAPDRKQRNMGTMTFQLPAELPADAERDLERACVAGGPDNMPWPTELHRQDGQLTAGKAVDESGYLLAPWPVEQIGQLMTSSATLME